MSWSIGETLSLTKAARAAMPFIRSAAANGLGATNTYNLLRENGMGARKQAVLDAYRAFTYAETNPDVYLPKDSRLKPDANLVPLTVTQQNRTWRTAVYHTMYDEDLDEYLEKVIIIDTSELKSVEDLVTLGAETLLSYGGNIEDIQDSGIKWINYTDNPFYSDEL